MSWLTSAIADLSALQRPGQFWAQVRGTWRIVVAVVAIQLICGCVGLYLKPFPDAFLSFWVGGALASLPAFLLGLWWHRRAVSESHSCKAIITLYGLSSILITVMAWPMAAIQSLVRASAA